MKPSCWAVNFEGCCGTVMAKLPLTLALASCTGLQLNVNAILINAGSNLDSYKKWECEPVIGQGIRPLQCCIVIITSITDALSSSGIYSAGYDRFCFALKAISEMCSSACRHKFIERCLKVMGGIIIINALTCPVNLHPECYMMYLLSLNLWIYLFKRQVALFQHHKA